MVGIALCLIAAAPQRNAEELAHDLLTGRTPANDFDYGALTQGPDSKAYIQALDEAVRIEILKRRGIPTDRSWAEARVGCLEPLEEAARAGIWSAKNSSSPAEWREAVRQARDADARRRSMIRALLAGQPALFPAYKPVEQFMAEAKAARDPIVAELFRRAAEEQAHILSEAAGKRTYARGVSRAAVSLLDDSAKCEVLRRNREWLKGVLTRRGWFKVSVDGPTADEAAWLIVQHADEDLAFQKSVLAKLEPLAPSGDTRGESFGLLYDRVAINEGRLQLYGTQGFCRARGDWAPRPIERPEEIDERRRRAGFKQTMDQYERIADRFLCP